MSDSSYSSSFFDTVKRTMYQDQQPSPPLPSSSPSFSRYYDNTGIIGTDTDTTSKLDFPEEKVKDLLLELYRIFRTYLIDLWTTIIKSIDEKRIYIFHKVLEIYFFMKEFIIQFYKFTLEYIITHLIPHSWKVQYNKFYEYIISSEQEQNNFHILRLLMDGNFKSIYELLRIQFNDCMIIIQKKIILLPSIIEEVRISYRNRPLWIQGLILFFICYGIYKMFSYLRRSLRRRRRRRRRRDIKKHYHDRSNRKRLQMKKGQSEILHGRTSLVYGAAGDLRDEEYLLDINDENNNDDGNGTRGGGGGGPVTGGRGRGRFNTFDFFGMNGPTPKASGGSNHNAAKQQGGYRNRNQSSFGDRDDYMFGVEKKHSSSSKQRGRGRTTSSENVGAMIRPRTESTNSVTDTFGGFFESFRGNNKTKTKTTPVLSTSTSSPSNQQQQQQGKHNKTKQKRRQSMNNTNTRLRKERLGSMDVYFAPGRDQPPLKPQQCNAFSQDERYSDIKNNIDNDRTRGRTMSSADGQQTHRDLGGVGNGFRSVSAEPHFHDLYNDDTTNSDYDDEDYNNDPGNNTNNNETRYLYDEFGVVTLSHRVEYYGPFKPMLYCGSSLIPPLSFEDVSRRIVSTEIDLPLKRILKIDILRGKLKVIEPSTTKTQNQKWDLSYNIDTISMKFHSLDGGVVSIYNKQSNGEETSSSDSYSSSAKEKENQQQQDSDSTWKEHTFESTHCAAQFQLDLLAYQVLGKPLRHLFNSLNLVHQGSLAYPGQEFVLHDNVRGDGGSNGDSEGKDKKKGDGEDDNKKLNNKSVEASQCVAWDDAMRAMSSIPTVRIALERLWLSHRRPSEISSSFEENDKQNNDEDNYKRNNKNKDAATKDNKVKNAKDKSKIALDNDKVSVAELSLLKEEYTKNRLLLGPVDFYRLFVPTLPETAIPEGDSNNRGRMEQLLCWRKRVARASVLVRSYTRARLVANRGWNLIDPTSTSIAVAASTSTGVIQVGDIGVENITKRFAYDGNENNNVRDLTAKNEIYEASVSRDVLCHVRPFDYLNDNQNDDENSGDDGSDSDNYSDSEYDYHQKYQSQQQQNHHLVLSPYQAYTYVGSHYFKASDEMLEEGGPLHPSRDPVDMFPSLKDIIARHPDLDFFVDCISNPDNNVMIVHLHVRSLAKGIDPHFDNVIERFSNCSEETRKRKLYLMFQLGNSVGLTFLGWLFLRLLSLYFRLTETGRDSPMNLESTRDRYGFPGFRVGSMFETYHFGGSLEIDRPNKPRNYLGLTKCVSASYYIESVVGKTLFTKLEHHFAESTVDFTFVIEGEKNDELPERALSTLRIVRVNPIKVAKDPRPYLSIPVPHHCDGDDDDVSYIDRTVRSSNTALHVIEDVVQDAVQFSLQSMKSIADLGVSTLPAVLSPRKKKKDGDEVEGRLLVITEENEMGVDTTISSGHLERHGGEIDPVEISIDWVIEILRTVMVPSRHLPAENFDPLSSSKRVPEEIEETGLVVMIQISALQMFDRNDIGRYIQNNNFEIKIAAEKLVETAAWRGRTFPIDKRRCRIELQNGQFFQQGVDRENNPVYYFRNLCRGPWRGDEEATILAILYRLDKSLNELSMTNPNTKATIIVLMGHSKRRAKKKKRESIKKGGDSGENKSKNSTTNGDKADAEGINSKDDDEYELDDGDDAESATAAELPVAVAKQLDLPTGSEIKVNTGNPRVSPDEKWTCHTSKEMMHHLFEILLQHYPGRLSKILMVKGRGKNHYYIDQIQGKWIMKNLLKNSYQDVIDKVKFVSKTSELTPYVPVEQLLAIVGGAASIDQSAYEFR